MPLETFVKGALTILVGVGTIGCGLLYYFQNAIIYPSYLPPGAREDVQTPARVMLPFKNVDLRAEDGVILRCYLMQQPTSTANHATRDKTFTATRATVLMFHGNAGNIGERVELAKHFYLMKCHVFMLSYRGYGKSDGSPSEAGLCMDAQAALDHILDDPQLSQTPVILYGQSLGGAVAIHLTSQNPSKIHALILENTFTSIPDVIPYKLPMFWFMKFLCHQKWESAKKLLLIPKLTPILMLSGGRDEVVPPKHMHELWAIAKSRHGSHVKGDITTGVGTNVDGEASPKVGNDKSAFFPCPYGQHNNTCTMPGYWERIRQFVIDVCS